MGCPDSVLSEPLLRHTQMNCILSNKNKEPYKDHLCLFRAFAMNMNAHNYLDTSIDFTEFVSKSGKVSLEDLPVVEEILQRTSLLGFRYSRKRIRRKISSTKYWKV